MSYPPLRVSAWDSAAGPPILAPSPDIQIQGALGIWQEAGGKGGAELREGGGVEKEI